MIIKDSYSKLSKESFLAEVDVNLYFTYVTKPLIEVVDEQYSSIKRVLNNQCILYKTNIN